MASPARRRSRDDRPAPSADRYRKPAVEDDDDDEEETPRARRRRERDAEPAPASSRRARAKDDDEDEDPPRRRGRAAADEDDEDEDDEEDEPPARSRSRGRAEPKRPARRARDDDEDDEDDEDEDEDDEDDEPRKRKSSAGWNTYNKKRKTMGSFSNDLKVPDDDQILIKFLDDEPFASFGQHWIMTPKGLRSYTCLESKCPLCDKLGDSPRAVGAFNVLLLEEDADPQLFVWACGPGIAQILEKKAAAKTGPLSKEYYAVSKTKPKGGKGATTYDIDVVRTRDLKEEWGIPPLKDHELDAFDSKMVTEDKYVRYVPRAELNAVARTAMDDDD
jgi:hypothetical protein